MKDFAKKIISAAAALTMAASMSVYAEETVPVENVNDGAPTVITEDSMNRVVGCVNHVTFRNDDHVISTSRGKHNVSGNRTCYTTIKKYGYNLICMKCGKTVDTVPTRMVVEHSIAH
ncbi:MAG: hypothetical protein HFE79_00480 [Ruminiclostridium sp.]|nr:hypothetical protein [Ruminiclostridium sp.]